MRWPYNYPGDEYLTNVFSEILILIDDVAEKVGDIITDIVDTVEGE